MTMKCENCGYFGGFDSDGMPICEHEPDCKYSAHTAASQGKEGDGVYHIAIDGQVIEDYVKRTVESTVRDEAGKIARDTMEAEMKRLIKDTYEPLVEKLTEVEIRKQVEAQVKEFMAGEMTVGGNWLEPARTLTREAYLSELIETEVKGRFEQKNNILKKDVEQICHDKINNFYKTLSREINQGIAQNFDEITRKTLTDSVVNMLMSSDTYKQLADTMGNLLPGKREAAV